MRFPGRQHVREELKESLLDEEEEIKGDELEVGVERDDVVTINIPTEESLIRWTQKRTDGEPPGEEVMKHIDEHTLSIPDLAQRYSTSLDPLRPDFSKGMDPIRAEAMLGIIGPNLLSPPPVIPQWKLFFLELLSPLNMMLICAALLSFLVSSSGKGYLTGLTTSPQVGQRICGPRYICFCTLHGARFLTR
ncbi:unnamed protein product [Discosporangium mesarthrocarpum]